MDCPHCPADTAQINLCPHSARRMSGGAVRFAGLCKLFHHFQDLPLRHPVEQKIGLCVEQHRAAHSIRPIIVMSEPPQGRLDSPQNDRNAFIRLPAQVRIHNCSPVRSRIDSPQLAFSYRSIGPQAERAIASWRIFIVRARFFICSIRRYHGVKRSGGHQKREPGLAEHPKHFRIIGVGPGEYGHLEAMSLEPASYQRRPK